MSHEITTAPDFGRIPVVVDGTRMEGSFDDMEMLERAYELSEAVSGLDQTADTKTLMASLRTMVPDAMGIIDAILGKGACDTLFGQGRRPVLRIMATVMQLAKIAGNVQARTFQEFAKTYTQ